jgi:hypothetical protein
VVLDVPEAARAMDAWGAFTAAPISGGNMVVPIGSVNARWYPSHHSDNRANRRIAGRKRPRIGRSA